MHVQCISFYNKSRTRWVPDRASDSKFKSSLGQRVSDGASDSEFSESVGQSVFKSSMGRWVSLYLYFNQSVLMS